MDLRERMVRGIDVGLSAKRALSVSCAVKLIHIPIRLQRRGGWKLIMMPEGVALPARKPSRDETLVNALVRAHHVCRLLPLTCLAPDIVEAILDGRQPKGLRLAEVLGNGPLAWEKQRIVWGISSEDQ
jgi:hypothetical protein